jgi:redox-sensitive bicupin YhaK (pirin superfamily)
MIKIIKYQDLGHHDYGWLDARYHFSFGEYRDPNRMGFGALRVINDDIVKAGHGFDTHPHRDMEIITYVRSGAITHRDSMGHEGRTAAGDVQVMSAGTGVFHSEHNHETVDTTLYQIWIIPRERNVAPRWDAMQFPKDFAENVLPLLVSGRAADADKSALTIHQDAAIYGGRMKAGTSITHPITAQAYVLVSEGRVSIDGETLTKGDGAEITDAKSVTFKALEDCKLVVIDVPA